MAGLSIGKDTSVVTMDIKSVLKSTGDMAIYGITIESNGSDLGLGLEFIEPGIIEESGVYIIADG